MLGHVSVGLKVIKTVETWKKLNFWEKNCLDLSIDLREQLIGSFWKHKKIDNSFGASDWSPMSIDWSLWKFEKKNKLSELRTNNWSPMSINWSSVSIRGVQNQTNPIENHKPNKTKLKPKKPAFGSNVFESFYNKTAQFGLVCGLYF